MKWLIRKMPTWLFSLIFIIIIVCATDIRHILSHTVPTWNDVWDNLAVIPLGIIVALIQIWVKDDKETSR